MSLVYIQQNQTLMYGFIETSPHFLHTMYNMKVHNNLNSLIDFHNLMPFPNLNKTNIRKRKIVRGGKCGAITRSQIHRFAHNMLRADKATDLPQYHLS